MEETLLLSNPFLSGLSPLYADYEAKCWWWQILTFMVTLVLCGPVLLLDIEGASQVFIQLVISAAMMVALANSNPYLHHSDDILAQLCQVALTFTMCVGLLEKAADDFKDKHFGPILVVCTTVQLFFGFIVAAVQYSKEKMPKTVKQLEAILDAAGPNEEFLVSSRQIQKSVLAGTMEDARLRVNSGRVAFTGSGGGAPNSGRDSRRNGRKVDDVETGVDEKVQGELILSQGHSYWVRRGPEAKYLPPLPFKNEDLAK